MPDLRLKRRGVQSPACVCRTVPGYRLRESAADDDNPGIENYIGRAEINETWQINRANTLGVTLRHSLRREAKG